MSISEPFIRRPVATTLLMAALAFTGLVAFPLLPVAPLPQVDFPTLQITAAQAGASAETMAASVAAPLERQFGQIAGVTQMTSVSSLGATAITVQFDLNRNIDSAAQDVQAAITAAGRQLPLNLSTPPYYRKINPADSPILILAARSDSLPLTTVDDYADNILAQQMSQVSGVAQVAIAGEQKPAIRVQVDPAKLSASGLTLEDVRAALVTTTTNAPKGTLNGTRTSFTIAANDQILVANQYDDIILAYRNGAPIRVRDLGHAVEEATDKTVAAFDGDRRCVLLIVYKQPGANVIDTVDKIKELLPHLTASIPPAVTVETLLDRTITIRASVLDVEFTLGLTVVLVVLVILLFLRNLWATFIPGVTVPLAIFGSLAAMYLVGFSLDNLSLMALTISVGFVVDDAIVVVENIHRHLEEGKPPVQAALQGAREIVGPVISMTITLAAVYAPIGFLGGLTGSLFREFAFTLAGSVIVSGVIALTLSPMMCSIFLKSAEEGRFSKLVNRVFGAITRGYGRRLDRSLDYRPITGLFALTILGLVGFLWMHTPSELAPEEDQGIVFAITKAPKYANIDYLNFYGEKLDKAFQKFPETDLRFVLNGIAGPQGGIAGMLLTPWDERKRSAIKLKPLVQAELSK
ncbi:MAG TPA: efflux RND transporter permease subunit, partial [Xanthobacteraceae bacterium]|nr:efflux RND transporter permease subunit [Xanthobacteraceae bacterium]